MGSQRCRCWFLDCFQRFVTRKCAVTEQLEEFMGVKIVVLAAFLPTVVLTARGHSKDPVVAISRIQSEIRQHDDKMQFRLEKVICSRRSAQFEKAN